MIYGMDFLAAAKYPLLALRSDTDTVGVMLSAFDSALPVIEKLAQVKKRIRVQGVWRDNHVFRFPERREAVLGAKNVWQIQQKYPDCDIYYSPYCEHRLDKESILKVLDRCQAAAPGLTLVNSPDKEGAFVKEYMNEVHVNDLYRVPRSKPYIVSFDGSSCVDWNVEKVKRVYANAEMIFFWIPQFNLRKSENDDTPRPERTCKPTKELIESVWYLRKDKGETSLSNAYIYKSHAEQTHNVATLRENKPCIIHPLKGKEIRLVQDDIVLAIAHYDAPYKQGGYIYRVSQWGYKLAMQAKGKPVSLQLMGYNGSSVFGTVNPAFRDGVYN